MRITEDKEYRTQIWNGLITQENAEVDPDLIHQHELLPCVRKGVAQRWAKNHGQIVSDRQSALYFLRGHSAEALIKRSEVGVRIVHRGVLCSVDWWTGGKYHFNEVKSTVMSSRAAWELLKAREFPLDTPHKFASWFKQCAVYCVAFGIRSCRLVVFFLHGEYGERRTKCPECNSVMEDGRLYKTCTVCGYKSYKIDLRFYPLEFAQDELAAVEHDIFTNRQIEFRAAERVRTTQELLAKTTPIVSFVCASCGAGELVGCPFFGSTEYA